MKNISNIFRVTINKKFQAKFKDRSSAGNILGDIIRYDIQRMRLLGMGDGNHHQLIVLGIPRGGIITGAAVARKLVAKFEVVCSKRLLAPNNNEITIGAMTYEGELYINKDVVKAMNIPIEYIMGEKAKRFREIKSMSAKPYLKTAESLDCKIMGKVAVLVDDGAASGATLLAALDYIMKCKPAYVIVGVPVAPKRTMALLKTKADKVEAIFEPSDGDFICVEQYYENFSPVMDNDVAKALVTKTNSET